MKKLFTVLFVLLSLGSVTQAYAETASILTIPLLTVHVVVVVRLTLARAGSNDKAHHVVG